jgi:hypothetical protein
MYRLVIAVALAGSLSITSSSDALARGGRGGGGGGGGGHVGHGVGPGFHFGGNFAGRHQGVGNRAASLGGIRGGPGSGFRPFPNSLHGAHFLNKHFNHQRRFQDKIIIYGGYGSNCYPVYNGNAWVSSCGLDNY